MTGLSFRMCCLDCDESKTGWHTTSEACTQEALDAGWLVVESAVGTWYECPACVARREMEDKSEEAQ